ncbi:MAG: GNAT family N-acetyltransferase [Thaumarchaeota archaeon]|nr:GNAT family N-acetyltransferase [Nitrososphaerota archaeon]
MKTKMITMEGIAVENGFRNIGIGAALMDLAEKLALPERVIRISLRLYDHDISPKVLQNL